MAGHPIDYYVYSGSWGTDEGRKIFSEEQMIDRWLKIEAALAEAEAEMGIIPDWAAREISAKASVERIDLNLARAEQQKTRHSLVPVIRAFAKVCGEKAGEYVHFGPTTQDIIDTGNMLALREVMDAVKRDLEAIEKRLVQITLEHADTPMAGRTHGQHALPITFGFKTASWLQEIRRHLDRLEEGRERILVGELAGAVGSYAPWGEQGRELEKRTMDRLGLAQSDIPWQSARDRFAEAVLLLAMICSTLGRIAGERYSCCKKPRWMKSPRVSRWAEWEAAPCPTSEIRKLPRQSRASPAWFATGPRGSWRPWKGSMNGMPTPGRPNG